VCASGEFRGERVYDSRPHAIQNLGEGIIQHFVGFFVTASASCFNSDEATMMDFDIPDSTGSGFCYVLPFSENNALVEITFYTKMPFIREFYLEQLHQYLINSFPDIKFEIVREEIGHIPLNISIPTNPIPKNVFDIGTRGGMTKPTTGYTFSRIWSDSRLLAEAASNPTIPLRKARETKPRFQFYDALFLSILSSNPHLLKFILIRFFQAQPFTVILKFLDEKTTIAEEIKIFMRMPILLFIKHLILFLLRPFLIRPSKESAIKILFFCLSGLGILANLLAPLWLAAHQLEFLFGVVLTTGLLHGSLDYYVENSQLPRKSLVLFLAKYVAQMSLVGLVWLIWPIGALGIFLVGTAWHFGDTDAAVWKLRIPTWASFLYGSSLVVWLFSSHILEMLLYLKDLGIDTHSSNDYLKQGGFSITIIGQFVAACLLLPILVVIKPKVSLAAIFLMAATFFRCHTLGECRRGKR
jgi:hypothetical protein